MLALARLGSLSCVSVPSALSRCGALVAPRSFVHTASVCASASGAASSAAAAPRPPAAPRPAASATPASSSATASPIARPVLKKWRLRGSGRWIDCAPYVTSITLCFDPGLVGTMGCKELWRQARSRKVRKEFSKYTVGLEVNQNGLPAVVKVVYVDGSKLDIPAQGKDAGELMLDVLGGTEGMKDKEDAAEMEKN